MVHPHIFFVLLSSYVLCSTLTIDYLKDCDVDKLCYVRESCIDGRAETLEKLTEFESTDKLKSQDCEILMTVKPYTDQKYLIIIRVKGQSMQANKLSLSQGDKPIVNCEKKDDGGIEVVVGESSLDALNPTPYEDHSHFNSTEVVCAFTITKPTTLSNFNTALTTTISFDQAKYDYRKRGIGMFTVPYTHEKCDPDSIQHMAEINGYHVQPLKLKARKELDCTNYNSDGVPYDYHLFVDQPDNGIMNAQVDKLECDFGTNQYKFNNGTDIFLSDSFVAYCAVQLSKTCKMPDLKCGDACPKPILQGRNDDPKIKCTDDKWLIGGVYYEGINPICKANEKGEAIYSMTYPNGDERQLTEGRCFTEYNCTDQSQLDISNCDADMPECGKVSTEGGILNCTNSEFDLKISSDSSVPNDTQQFKCDPLNGLYRSSSNHSVTVPINSRVSCSKKREKKDEKISSALFTGICIGSSMVAILVVVCISAICLCLFNKRNRLRGTIMKKKEKWKRMSPSEKIADAQRTFGKAGQSSPGEEPTLLDALKLLDAIIDTESEDVELWEVIKVFLKRLQGVAHSKDYAVERMLNRYCYLQAKKMIEKHGWISPSRITKSKPNGYIRVGAIYLLSIARRDVVEAQEMILEGFKKLRFDAVEQYPHCGLLWSLLTQQRVGSIRQHEKLIKRLTSMVDPAKFYTKKGILRPIEDIEKKKEENKRLEIPEEDLFPHFGSIRNQCCYAFAASDLCENSVEAGAMLFELPPNTKTRDAFSLSKSLLEGSLDCTSGNNVLLMKHFGIKGSGLEYNHAGDNYFKQLIPSPVELEQVMTKLVFHRRMRDARTYEKRYDGLNIDEEKTKKLEEKRDEKMKLMSEEEKVEEKNKLPPRSLKPSCKLYSKVKECHRLFVSCFKEENKDIQDWLRDQMGKNEAKKAEKSQSRSETSPMTTKGNEDVDDPFDVEEFVAAFYKESTAERIRKCPLDENEQDKLRSILNQILGKETILGVRVQLAAVQVVEVCQRVTDVTMTEPMLIEDVPAGITVVTDLHGQLYDLARIFDANAKGDKPGYECDKYLFTGDYVDRGAMSLEVVMALFILKILYPDRFFILRGNHEYVEQNMKYGFLEEIEDRYANDAAELLYRKLTETFMYLSAAGIVGGQILCVHGGISAGPFTRHELRLLRKPIASSSDDLLLQDISWSDPAKGMEGYFFNYSRSCGIYFGDDALQNALDRIECTTLIRGHTMLTKGYNKFGPNCLPLFSATAIDPKLNNGAIVRISDDLRFQVVTLKYHKEREVADLEFYGSKKEDEPTVCDDEEMGDGEIMEEKE